MSYFFNGDFESFLASEMTRYVPQSNRINQEFEYFILWLEEEPLYSKKKYSTDYLSFIEKFKSCCVTSDMANIKLWCVEDYDKDEQRKINSKIETTKFAIVNKLSHRETSIIDSCADAVPGYIYKSEFGVSGGGTWDFKKMPKSIKYPLIRDRKLSRTFDFSALVEIDKVILYQNHVDDFFQYKGTTLGLSFEYFDWFDQYLLDIEKIRKKFSSTRNPMSIDSFLYEENGREHVYTLCEINNRKTMGYITYKLRESFFSDFKYSRLRIFSRKYLEKEFSYLSFYESFDKKVIPLSPLDNKFVSFMILENSLGELNELEDLLVSSYFPSFIS